MMNDLFAMSTGCARQSSNAEHSALRSLAQNFAAIDFETANCRRGSVCSVGIVIVRGGEIADKFYSLIRPEPSYYTCWTTEVHGLTRADTDTARPFPEVWAEMADRLKGLPFVAHNKAFDEQCHS